MNDRTEGKGEPFFSYNPATEEVVWEGRTTSQQQLNQAIAEGRKAYTTWSQTPVEKRISLLEQFATLVEQQAPNLAQLISQETGKPLWESHQEVQAVRGKIPLTITAYQQRTMAQAIAINHRTLMIHHRPYGVFAVLGPFNLPAHLPNGQIAPALLAGNTVIFKPSEQTPAVGAKLVELYSQAGLPPGALQLIQGNGGVGEELATHPQIDGLWFTGSAETGLKLSQTLTSQPHKLIAIEGGGNNPLVIGKIGKDEVAAIITLLSAFLTSGQRCSCARRLITISPKSKFLKKLSSMLQKLIVAPYTTTPEPFMGPLISKQRVGYLLEKQQELIQQGANAILPMTHPDTLPPSIRDNFLTPGLIDVTSIPQTDRVDQEWFGPLLQVIRVSSMEEALVEANRTSYGLTAGLLSENKEEWTAFQAHIRAGIVNWNTPLTGASGRGPFGGIGISGNHHPAGFYAIDSCTYPVASLAQPELLLPSLPQGLQEMYTLLSKE